MSKAEEWIPMAKKYAYLYKPSAPSEGDLKIIQKYISKIRKVNPKPNVLVLGCTIPTRKFLNSKRIPTTVADHSRSMYNAVTKNIPHVRKNESFVCKDWISMNLKKKFDVIIGDFVIPNVPVKNRKKFYKNLKKHLSKEGILMIRDVAMFSKTVPIKEIAKKYKGKRVTQSKLIELRWDLLMQASINRKKRTMNNGKAYKKLEEMAIKYPYLEKWRKAYKENLPTAMMEYRIFKLQETLKDLKKYFKIVAIEQADDYVYHEIVNTFVLK